MTTGQGDGHSLWSGAGAGESLARAGEPRSLSHSVLGVALEGEYLGVVDEPVDHHRGHHLAPKISSLPPDITLFEAVTIIDARS
jgi:hypothetical protein